MVHVCDTKITTQLLLFSFQHICEEKKMSLINCEPGHIKMTIECLCLGAISLSAPWKSAVLKTSIFVLRTSTLYCLNSTWLRKIPGWIVLIRENFSANKRAYNSFSPDLITF